MPLLPSVTYLLLALAGVLRNIVHMPLSAGIIKTLPALFLMVCAWAYSRPRFGPWVAIGVALGALGDYSLANADRAWFMAGLCSFLAGHIAYSIAFAKDLRWNARRGFVIGLTALAMAVLAGAVSISMLQRGETGLIAPVCVYVVIMGVMMALGVLHDSPTRLIAAGGVIFVISDAHIAVNHMLLHSSRLGPALSGYITYYLAQYMLVAGAIYEARRFAAQQRESQ